MSIKKAALGSNDQLTSDSKRLGNIMARTIDFEQLIQDGVIEKRGGWYEILKELPADARYQITEIRHPNLVKFRKQP